MPQEYLTNTPLEDALQAFMKHLDMMGTERLAESISVRDAMNRITASAIYARRSVPHYLASAMDGVALLAAVTYGASETAPVDLNRDACTMVDTGDSMPDGTDAVVMIEDIIDLGDRIRLIAPAVPWQHVRQIGEDFCAGDMLACSGTLLTPALLGALVAGGVRDVPVLPKPRITLIPTGDEIVSPEDEPAAGLIPEFNTTIYRSFLENDGAIVHVTPIIPDDPVKLQAVLSEAIDQSDLVLLMAGSSAGRDDLSKTIIQSLGEVVFHGLAIRPGKPAILAVCRQKPVIGLPGYPVSGLVVLEEVVRPILRKRFGMDIPHCPVVEARLTRRLVSSLKYQEYIRVRLTFSHGQLVASPLDRGAGVLTSYARADGMLVVSRDREGFEEGASVPVRLMRPLSQIENALSVIGSHDPLLDEMADLLFRSGGQTILLSSVHAGSMGGILAVRRHEAQVAGIHLLDEANGLYNQAFVRRYFPAGGVFLIEGVRRQQGLLVQAGNPMHIQDLTDIVNRQLRYVNRQKGAGTRLLLDHQLKLAGLTPEQLSGYSREEYTHTGVAAQIAAGTADAGMGILSAARIAQLDFIPVAEECYDFLIDGDAWDQAAVHRLIEVLQSDAFRQRLELMGGYRLEQPGRIIIQP